MSLSEIVLSVNTAGTLAIGGIAFFIVWSSFRGIDDSKIEEFSKRFMMALAFLILYVSYFLVYNLYLTDLAGAIYLLYFLLVVVFIMLIYSSVAFEELAQEHGISMEDKIERMEKEELTD